MYVRSLCLRTVLAVVAAVLLPSSAALAGEKDHSKLDRELRAEVRSGHPSAQRVIIQVRSGAREALERALVAHGDVIVAEHPSIGALTAEVHGEDLAALDRDPNVLAVSCDADVTVTSDFAYQQVNGRGQGKGGKSRPAVPTAPDVLRETLGVDQKPYAGAGIGIAILDSGVFPVRDLDTQLRGFWDFTRNGIPSFPYDDYGHGTHVAGLIASSGVQSKGVYQGIAPRARLFGFKVLDRSGHGRTSDVIRALDFVVANRHFLGIDVINLSLGHPIFEPAGSGRACGPRRCGRGRRGGQRRLR